MIFFVPVEMFRRVIGWQWVLEETIRWHDIKTGRYLSAQKGMRYDKFTLFPDLRKLDGSPSDGCAVHDAGWNVGKWDDGSILTFDDNNRLMRNILRFEQQREAVVRMVDWGVSLWFMRRRWERTFGHG